MFKALIVEDEPLIRSGIAEAIVRQCPLFDTAAEAASGDEALHLALDLLPDLIITDIEMPRMNGIHFLEQLSTEYAEAAVVLISGHDEFEYAQKGLQLGAKDYLLKPVDTARLVQLVNRIGEELSNRHLFQRNWDELQRKVRESLPLFRERFYRQLMAGAGTGASLARQAKELGIPMNAHHYIAALLAYAAKQEMDRGMEQAMVASFIDKAAAEFGESLEVHHFFERDRRILLFLGSHEEAKDACYREFSRFGTYLCTNMQRNFDLERVKLAFGSPAASLTGLSLSSRQAEEGMQISISMDDRSVIHYDEWSSGVVPEPKDSAKLTERLLRHLKLEEEQLAEEAAVRLLGDLTAEEGANPHWIRLTLLELAMTVIRQLEKMKILPEAIISDPDVNPYVNVYHQQQAKDLQAWLIRFVRKCLREIRQCRANRSVSYVEKVKVYVEEHLADRKLSLGDAAARLFISPNYLRQLFRQETGESFVEYVTRLRMETAMNLLKDPFLKIQQVADRVGFEDQRYFSSCFKKYYGITPSEYREALQNELI